MNKIKAILVDDEESARDVLENLLRRFCPEIDLLDKCSNVVDAVESIKKHQPDLVFLDFEMPKYSGIEIVNFFDTIPFEIVFFTAYDKYALKAFEVSAIDYLLKPIDIDRLKSSIEKVIQKVDLKQNNTQLKVLSETLKTNEVSQIILYDKGHQQVISLTDIIAVEAFESYSTFHTTQGKYTASKNLKHFERLFDEVHFLNRVHKSWIVNLNFIQNYSKTDLVINLETGIIAKLSKYKKAEFEQLLHQ
jgi:two-component system LytT family response regulator